MKKKGIISLIVIAIIMNFALLTNTVKAYSNSDYSVDIPSGYASAGTNMWKKLNGDNFNVQVRTYTGGVDDKSMDDLLNEIMDELVKLTMYGEVKTKEVATISKNNYKCAHITAKLSGYPVYADQYEIISKGKIFALTFVSASESYFKSEDVQKMLESFTIAGYEDPTAKNIPNDSESVNKSQIAKFVGIIVGLVIGGIVLVVIIVLVAVKVAKSKKKEEE